MLKQRLRLPGAAILLVLLCSSCASRKVKPFDQRSALSANSEDANAFQFATTNMMASGVWGNPMMAWDPDIIREGNKVHFFFASLFCKKDNDWYFSWNPDDFNACSIQNVSFSIGYAFKDESVSDKFVFRPTPLIELGKIGEWDDGQIETPEVIRRGSKYFMFYSAMPKNRKTPNDKSARYQIGVASIDLADHGGSSLQDLLLKDTQIRFQKNIANPILPNSNIIDRFDRENTQEPTVIYRDGRFELFYTGIRADKKGTNQPLDQDEALLDNAEFREIGLGRICLNDALSRQACPLDDKPLLTMKFTPGGPEGTMVNMPNVYWHQNRYYLFYTRDGGKDDNHQGEKIYYRTTLDLINWEKENLIIAGGESDEDNWGVHSPAVAMIDTDRGSFFEMVYQSWGVGPRGEDNPFCIKKRFRVSTNSDAKLCNSTAIGFARQKIFE